MSKAKAPIANYITIEVDASLEKTGRGARDLPKAGDARSHVEAREMFNFVGGVVVQWMWSRAYQAHVSLQYVPQLGKFVEAIAAQDTPEARDA